ncbi:ATP-binding cassette domain-containing protein [Kytococcus schroeteri]|uniref:ATP-binding cassette domain-containing protein n=1 Tax=Kytococcus schroeteri TaxID=138300 RepID=UPI00192D6C30|nr:ATP-binding cassette domain-containing protein [Kytococcus schroeteri]
MQDEFVLVAERLSMSVPGRVLWKGVDLTVAPGERLALVGPSGCGKTTLLNCLAGLESPGGGSVRLEGTDLTSASGRTMRRLRRDVLGVLFQDHGLVPTQTIGQNLDYGFSGRTVRRADRPAMRAQVLDRVGVSHSPQTKTLTLSGGEQQRVALARLLLQNPRVVFADEPTASLDDGNVQVVQRVFDEMASLGTAIVMATHDDRMMRWADSMFDLSAAVGRAA